MRIITNIFIASLIMLSIDAFSQQINVKEKYYVCLQLSGTSCNGSCFSTSSEWSSSDPCLIDRYYMAGEPPQITKAVCCSYLGMARPTTLATGLMPFYYANLFIALDTFQVIGICDGDDEEVVVADFSLLVPNWPTVLINAYTTDSLVIDMYQPDTVAPYYKPLTKTTVKYGASILSGLCLQPQPNMNNTGLKATKIAEVFTNFYPNPINDDVLRYKLVDQNAISENLKFKFYNMIGELILEYIPNQSSGNIDLKNFPNGPIFVLITSDNKQESQTIVINR